MRAYVNQPTLFGDTTHLDRLVEDLLRGVPALGTANPAKALNTHRTHTRTVDDKSVTWKFPVPGAKPSDVSLEVSGANDLVVNYTRADGGFYESFKEVLSAPVEYDLKRAEAQLVDGLLTITANKAEKKVHKIAVKG